jgi:hypothetical protein
MDVRAFFPSRTWKANLLSLPFPSGKEIGSPAQQYSNKRYQRGSSTPALNSHRHSKPSLPHVIQSRSPAVTVRIVLPYGKRRDGMTGI